MKQKQGNLSHNTSAVENYRPNLNIVLIAPEIPQNSGNIGRLCVNTASRLHFIKPLGFSLDERDIRRAGLDYWQQLDYRVYPEWREFLLREISQATETPAMYFISRFGEQNIYDVSFKKGDYLIFGNESRGLPEKFYQEYAGDLYRIPILSDKGRSLNLANAVAVTAFEALRIIYAW